MNVDITVYGACAEKGFLNTKAIQNAVDDCSQKGGGRVTVPAGTFLTGSIFLRDNVELHLEHCAVLLGSPDLADYNALDAYPQNYSYPPEQWLGHHLIIASNVKNAAITGTGTIDGNGKSFFEENPFYNDDGTPKPGPRPVGCTVWRTPVNWRLGICLAKDKEKLRPGQMVVFAECRNVAVKDVTLTDSPCWSLLFLGCEDVRVSGVRIDNPLWNANTDGIDIDCSKNVVVSDSIISTGDDAITLRGCCHRLVDKSRICENIAVTNCVLRSSVNGVRVGVGTGTIRNAVFSNIVVSFCGHAVEIQPGYNNSAGKGVDISGIRFQNLTVREAGFPVVIHTGSANATSPVRDISFANCSFEAYHGFRISGTESVRHENISFDDVSVRIVPAPTGAYGSENNRTGMPPPEHFLCIEYTKDVRFRATRFLWATNDPWWKTLTQFGNNENLIVGDSCVFPEKREV